jgi:hypothetical protein
VPTVVNSYVGRKVVEAPPVVEQLPTSLEGYSSTPTGRRPNAVRREFDTDDWVERSYSRSGDDSVQLMVARSYDMKRLYHHPELALSERDYPEERLVEAGGAAGPVVLHVLEGDPDGLVVYALLYGRETVGNPYVFQLKVVPEAMLTGRRPLTLVFAEQTGPSRGRAVEETPAFALVRAALASLTK